MAQCQQLTLSWFPFDEVLEQIYRRELQTAWCQQWGHPVGLGTIYYTLATEHGYTDIDQAYCEQWYAKRRWGN